MRRREKTGGGIGLGVALLAIAAGFVRNVPPGVPIALAALAALIILASVASYLGVGFVRTERPRLVVDGDPDYHLAETIGPYRWDDVEYQSTIMLVAIPFTNTARSGREGTTATGVSPTLEIFDAGGKRIGRSHGRWREFGWQPEQAALTAEPRPTKNILPPDGSVHLLDVMFRHGLSGPRQATTGCYLMRDRRALLLRWPVPSGRYRLTLTLRGDNVAATAFEYDVVVPDDSKPFSRPVLTRAS